MKNCYESFVEEQIYLGIFVRDFLLRERYIYYLGRD